MPLNPKTPGSSWLYQALWTDLSGRWWSWSSTIILWTERMAWLRAGHGNFSFASLETVDGPLSSCDYFTALLGRQSLSYYPRSNVRFISQRRSAVGPPPPTPDGYFSPHEPGQLSSPVFPCVWFYVSPSRHFTSVSTFELFLPFPFLLLFTNFYSPTFPFSFASCYFHIGPFSALPVLLKWPFLRSLFTLVYYQGTTFAPSQCQFYLFFRCASLLISFLFFLCLSFHIIMFLLSPGSARGNFTME